MRGDYSPIGGVRPRLPAATRVARPASARGQDCGRQYFCRRCRSRVLICSHCDRGHRYCTRDCATLSRRDAQQRAGQRYQDSRRGRLFVRFFLDARMENFLRGHVGAFQAFGGVSRVILYDNLKSAVLERQGDAIRFNPALLDFAGHYRYEPRPVAVARGNEKGRVERSIRYLRESFFAAREFIDVDDLNAQVDVWCQGLAADRRCPGQPTITVREAFAEERSSLLPLPENAFPVTERVAVSARKTPYVRYDKNDYSIPHSHVGRPLTLLAETREVRIVDGARVLARHARSYDKGAQIEDPAHVAGLVAEKRAARHLRGNDRLAASAPASRILLATAAEQGGNLGSITAALLRLLDRYGAAELQTALIEALEREIPHPSAVRFALERRRDERRQTPAFQALHMQP